MSPRPGYVKSVIPIELGRERHLDIRDEPEFTRYTREIREQFQEMGLLNEAVGVKLGRRMRNAIAMLLQHGTIVLTLAAVILFWEFSIYAFDVPDFVVPSPANVWRAIIKSWPNLVAHSQVTLAETLAGFGSLVDRHSLAVCIVYSRIIEQILYPLLVASQAVPKVALAQCCSSHSATARFLKSSSPSDRVLSIVVNTVTGLASVDRNTLRFSDPWARPTHQFS